MAPPSLRSVLAATIATGTYLIPIAAALNAQLVGTWTTKSAKVLTGPGFYNPINDSFIEPSHTGISYSFTADGHYEEAYFRAIANPEDPSCPGAIMQFQHGTVAENADNSLTLTPFAVDGRQLLSRPCNSSYGVYTRYNQTEIFKHYAAYKDPYHGVSRLDLYQYDGAPMIPMYIAYSPPLMLPTQTMNPTSTSTASGATATASKKSKRGVDSQGEYELPLNKDAKHVKRDTEIPSKLLDASLVWWLGMVMTFLGGAAYLL